MTPEALSAESEALLREHLEFGRFDIRLSQTQLTEHLVAIEAAAAARIEAAEADADRLAAAVSAMAEIAGSTPLTRAEASQRVGIAEAALAAHDERRAT